jgi:ABC-type glycerol-3-phosphate transport system substrate-binding protein
MGFKAPLAHGVFKHAKNPDAGFEFAAYLGSAAPQVQWMEETGYFPTSSAAAEEKFIADNRQFDTAVAGLTSLPYTYTFPGLTAWRDLTCLPEFQKCLIGTQTPEGAAKVIVDKLNVVAKAAAAANRARYAAERGK